VSGDAVDRLCDAAEAAHRSENRVELERLAREIIVACEPSADPRVARGYRFLGITYAWQNDARSAKQYYERAFELFASSNDRRGMMLVTVSLAYVAGEVELDNAKARHFAEQAMLMARELRDEEYLPVTLGNFQEVCRLEGDYVAAIRYGTESAALFAAQKRFGRAGAQHAAVAHSYLLRRDEPSAFAHMSSAWNMLQREPIPRNVAWYFEVWFMIAAAIEEWETAARLYGFIDHYRDVSDARRLQGILPRLSGSVERVYAMLGEERANQLIVEGERLTLETAQALAESVARG
jgi:tetratricopeptide (TPR) repeat protein